MKTIQRGKDFVGLNAFIYRFWIEFEHRGKRYHILSDTKLISYRKNVSGLSDWQMKLHN